MSGLSWRWSVLGCRRRGARFTHAVIASGFRQICLAPDFPGNHGEAGRRCRRFDDADDQDPSLLPSLRGTDDTMSRSTAAFVHGRLARNTAW
jgi:hypothetical protein